MPELPEVETVRRILEKEIVGLTFKSVNVIYPRLINAPLDEFNKLIPNSKIISLTRKGKYLILNLSNCYSLIVHFRMEGKLFHVFNLEDNLNKYVTCYFTFNDGTFLIFNDVRKFGVFYLYKTDEINKCKELAKLGKEPWDISDSQYLLDKFKNNNNYLKEALLDQSIIAGLGNIYADEVLFKSKLNPFRKACTINKEEANKIIKVASDELKLAIQNKGSTILTYHPSLGVSGNMQHFLEVYNSKNKPCPICSTLIEKRYVNGRGTCYCYKCQKVYPSIAITGKIASGKTRVLNLLKERNFHVASADDIVHKLYGDQDFIDKLMKKFKNYSIFRDNEIDKKALINKMFENKKFRRSYQLFIWSAVKEKINNFIINNTDYFQAIEVPLLFEAKMEDDFTYLIGVETTKQMEYLKIRNDEDPKKRLQMNSINSYDKNKNKLDFIIQNNNDLESLNKQVDKIVDNIKNNL